MVYIVRPSCTDHLLGRSPLDIVAYDEMVARLAAEKSTEMISNGCTSHAAVLIKHLFKSARQSVKIFSGNLDNCVYGQYEILTAAQQLLERGGHINIVVQQSPHLSPHSQPSLVDYLCSFDVSHPGNQQWSLAIGDAELQTIRNHFVVADDVAYRYETDVNTHEAMACFNDEVLSKDLALLFSEMEGHATKIKLDGATASSLRCSINTTATASQAA